MEILALIPISGLDEEFTGGIPRLGARSLPGHTFEAARASRRCTRRIVVTDGDALAEEATRYELEVPFLRPRNLRGPLAEVFVYTLDWLNREEGYQPDWVVHLQITHPFRPNGFIDDAIETVFAQAMDSAFAAYEERHSFWFFDATGAPQRLASSHRGVEGEREPIFRELSGLFSMATADLVRGGQWYGVRVGIIPVHDPAALIDVRDPDGLALATWYLGRVEGTVTRREAGRPSPAPDLPPTDAGSPEAWDAVMASRPSLVARRAIRSGERLTAELVEAKLPYRGISASLLPRLLGCRFKYDVQPGDAITFGLLDFSGLRTLSVDR